MAEERLIDEDKDRKYKIRKNADGEDELYIDESAAPAEEETEEVMFDVPEYAYDDEEAAVMTPEQLAIKKEQEEKERQLKEEKLKALISTARSDMAAGNYATALDALGAATELDDENGEAYALRMAVYTQNFTDYSQVITAAEEADEVAEYATSEIKAELIAAANGSIEANIAELEKETARLNEENEAHKAERALKFVKDRRIAIILYSATMAVLATFIALTAYYGSLILTVETNKYVVVTIVFGVLAFCTLVASLFVLRRLLVTCRRVRLNKKNTATKLGRELISAQKRLDAFRRIYSALNGSADLS